MQKMRPPLHRPPQHDFAPYLDVKHGLQINIAAAHKSDHALPAYTGFGTPASHYSTPRSSIGGTPIGDVTSNSDKSPLSSLSYLKIADSKRPPLSFAKPIKRCLLINCNPIYPDSSPRPSDIEIQGLVATLKRKKEAKGYMCVEISCDEILSYIREAKNNPSCRFQQINIVGHSRYHGDPTPLIIRIKQHLFCKFFFSPV